MAHVAVVIPCYRVSAHILSVLSDIGPEVSSIIVVDDCCPEHSGKLVQDRVTDPRVEVIWLPENRGVGGAVIAGYERAIERSADVVVKLDGDGQMSPRIIPRLIRPILEGSADYAKGNRFFVLESLKSMPPIRLFGNAVLSFLNKAVTGYWGLMDPTNGFTAIHGQILALLPFDKIDCRYFFESDMLFRLNTIRAVICDVPMDAAYGSEKSSLKIGKVLLEFPGKYAVRFSKRLFYNYFLRDFNLCSFQIMAGSLLFTGGTFFGLYHWIRSYLADIATPLGTIMLAVVPVILGFQLLLSAATFDVMNSPKDPLHLRLRA